MENLIEHKFSQEEIFFVYPQGEIGIFSPDILIKLYEGQEGYLVENKKVFKTLRVGMNSIVERFSGFVYFLNKKDFQKRWGTLEPVPFKQKNSQLNYIKAYGYLNFFIEDGKKFVEKLLAEKEFFITEEFVDFLRNLVFYEFSNVLKNIEDLDKENIEKNISGNLELKLKNIGLNFIDFKIVGGNFIEEKKELEKSFCRKCKKEITIKANFCPFCGDKISNLCPSCQREIPEFANFCPFCGLKIK